MWFYLLFLVSSVFFTEQCQTYKVAHKYTHILRLTKSIYKLTLALPILNVEIMYYS